MDIPILYHSRQTRTELDRACSPIRTKACIAGSLYWTLDLYCRMSSSIDDERIVKICSRTSTGSSPLYLASEAYPVNLNDGKA